MASTLDLNHLNKNSSSVHGFWLKMVKIRSHINVQLFLWTGQRKTSNCGTQIKTWIWPGSENCRPSNWDKNRSWHWNHHLGWKVGNVCVTMRPLNSSIHIKYKTSDILELLAAKMTLLQFNTLFFKTSILHWIKCTGLKGWTATPPVCATTTKKDTQVRSESLSPFKIRSRAND